MLSKEVRDAIEAELEHMKLRKRLVNEKLDARIKALEAVLAPVDDFAPQQQPLVSIDNRVAQVGPDGPLAGKGLREAMRTVLSSYPGGLRPADLAAKIEQLGFQSTGKLPIRTRVWSEIARLRKENRVNKRGKRVVWVGVVPTNNGAEPESGGSV